MFYKYAVFLEFLLPLYALCKQKYCYAYLFCRFDCHVVQVILCDFKVKDIEIRRLDFPSSIMQK